MRVVVATAALALLPLSVPAPAAAQEAPPELAVTVVGGCPLLLTGQATLLTLQVEHGHPHEVVDDVSRV